MNITIENFINNIQKLPGIGPKSAKRLALHMIRDKQGILLPIMNSMQMIHEKISNCRICGNIDTCNPCSICNDSSRDNRTICVVEDIIDLWAFEAGKNYTGLYHVLGGALSAINGMSPNALNIDSLSGRLADQSNVREVIIATNATLSGQTTASYIANNIKNHKIQISRLAFGVPVGGELDYLDSGTISIALNKRYAFGFEEC